ncbi:MAG: twin-arginine translocation signal domain-containing protein [Acidimicrobiales bacterium]
MKPDLSRRSFLGQASLGAAVAGAVAAAPNLVKGSRSSTTAVAPPAPIDLGALPATEGPIVAHVRDVASGQVVLMMGTSEVVYQDHNLARTLARAAQSATAGGL